MLQSFGDVGHSCIQRSCLEVNGVPAGGDGHRDTIRGETLDASAIVVVLQIGAHIDSVRAPQHGSPPQVPLQTALGGPRAQRRGCGGRPWSH